MLREYDVVTLVRAIEVIPVATGIHGTVVIVHNSMPIAYEIEFVDENGNSLGVYTLQDHHVVLATRS